MYHVHVRIISTVCSQQYSSLILQFLFSSYFYSLDLAGRKIAKIFRQYHVTSKFRNHAEIYSLKKVITVTMQTKSEYSMCIRMLEFEVSKILRRYEHLCTRSVMSKRMNSTNFNDILFDPTNQDWNADTITLPWNASLSVVKSLKKAKRYILRKLFFETKSQ